MSKDNESVDINAIHTKLLNSIGSTEKLLSEFIAILFCDDMPFIIDKGKGEILLREKIVNAHKLLTKVMIMCHYEEIDPSDLSKHMLALYIAAFVNVENNK
jgi:hypothetical protein